MSDVNFDDHDNFMTWIRAGGSTQDVATSTLDQAQQWLETSRTNLDRARSPDSQFAKKWRGWVRTWENRIMVLKGGSEKEIAKQRLIEITHEGNDILEQYPDLRVGIKDTRWLVVKDCGRNKDDV